MGKLSNVRVKKLTQMVATTPGDYAEIGVWEGRTLARTIPYAERQGKNSYAFDSFEGMNDPGDKDAGQYPKGKFDVGGVEAFHEIMKERGVDRSRYNTFAGFIPDCLDQVHNDHCYSLILLDVDQYEPTEIALPWCWKRLNVGGLLILDDFFQGRKDKLASGAIHDWLKQVKNYSKVELEDTLLVLTKT